MDVLVLLIMPVLFVAIQQAFDASPSSFVERPQKPRCRLECFRKATHGDAELSSRDSLHALQSSTQPRLRVVSENLQQPKSPRAQRKQRAQARLRQIRSQGDASLAVQSQLIWMLSDDRAESDLKQHLKQDP